MPSDNEQRTTLRCKPGTLAIVIDSGIEELIGLIVEVLHAACDGEHDWLTQVQGKGVLAPGIATGIVMRRTRILMLDQHLVPLNDGADVRSQALLARRLVSRAA